MAAPHPNAMVVPMEEGCRAFGGWLSWSMHRAAQPPRLALPFVNKCRPACFTPAAMEFKRTSAACRAAALLPGHPPHLPPSVHILRSPAPTQARPRWSRQTGSRSRWSARCAAQRPAACAACSPGAASLIRLQRLRTAAQLQGAVPELLPRGRRHIRHAQVYEPSGCIIGLVGELLRLYSCPALLWRLRGWNITAKSKYTSTCVGARRGFGLGGL